MVCLDLLYLVHIHDEYGPEGSIPPVHIRIALVQFFPPILESVRLNREALNELVVMHQMFISVLGLESGALEEPLD
jgi:hypothetical protein